MGTISLVHRYYDPATSQFLSVDPLVDVTGTPYAYINGDPVNGIDPLGLGFWSDVASVVTAPVRAELSAVSSVVGFTAHHWRGIVTAAGIALGVAAAATGVGAVIEGATALGITLSATAVVTGTAAGALDSSACAAGNTLACIGKWAGIGGSIAGLGPLFGGLLSSLGVIEEAGTANAILSGFFGGFGFNVGLLGLTLDTATAAGAATPRSC